MMKRRGFTLIELMTVVSIISILAAIAVPNFMNAQYRAKVARSIAEQEILAWAVESYFVDQDHYPPNAQAGTASPWDLVPITTPIAYISQLPEDIFLAPNNVEKGGFIEVTRKGNRSYYYVNFVQQYGGRMSLAPYGKKGSANFVVYGLGPTYTNTFDPGKPETFIEYSPSNGTVSEGNVFTFGP